MGGKEGGVGIGGESMIVILLVSARDIGRLVGGDSVGIIPPARQGRFEFCIERLPDRYAEGY